MTEEQPTEDPTFSPQGGTPAEPDDDQLDDGPGARTPEAQPPAPAHDYRPPPSPAH